MKTNITIIGFGTMGKAIAKTLLKNTRQNKISGIKIFTIDKDKKNVSGIEKSDFIILATKPQDANKEIIDVKKHDLNKKTILISIMAGFSIKKIMQLSGHKKIVRMMPNLGLSIGEGIAVWKKVNLSNSETKKVKKFLNKITENFEVKDEETIDKITAISGSGPAYFLLLADYLIKASKSLGLTEKEARKLVEKTFSASAILGKDSNYSALIKKIASKGGTTEAALKTFKDNNFDKIDSKAVLSAYKRARQLSHKFH